LQGPPLVTRTEVVVNARADGECGARRLLRGSDTCKGDTFTLSARLEPVATIAGDTDDYSVEREARQPVRPRRRRASS
jgi:hypothetical protein